MAGVVTVFYVHADPPICLLLVPARTVAAVDSVSLRATNRAREQAALPRLISAILLALTVMTVCSVE